ncbi:MAG: cysteine--tRNA ligase [Oligoflexia bacterium]|nr:cysteine--tRNA ligase [Oligoflexia bacterium]
MKIYNTLTQKKEEFKPIKAGELKMYLCGPTVYNLVHVGNFRGPIFFNFVRNYFQNVLNYKVKFVYNYTDVDDKIINKAIEENIAATEVSEKYIKEFEKDFKAVGLRVADVNPKVTEHIKEIVSLIEDIIKNGAAYVVDGEVFCSIEKIKDYGKLSHKNIQDLIAGARVEIGEKKKNPLDFSLWKPAKPGEPSWDSPWGKGRPGWHIECSAMAKKHLGETIDIHGGGIDLIFPHHENEIAQSESANNKNFVNYWMHNNFINMGKDKMSKSLGNIFTVRKFVEVFNGEILKFLILSAHYRSGADFSDNVIEHAIAGLARIYSSLAQAEKMIIMCQNAGFKYQTDLTKVLDPSGFGAKLNELWPKMITSAEDDFNTPEILAEIFNLVRSFNNLLKPGIKPTQELLNSAQKFKNEITKVGSLMSLFEKPAVSFLKELDDILLEQKNLKREEIQLKVDARSNAKAAKDFIKADKLRAELTQMGIELRDNPGGTEWEVRK